MLVSALPILELLGASRRQSQPTPQAISTGTAASGATSSDTTAPPTQKRLQLAVPTTNHVAAAIAQRRRDRGQGANAGSAKKTVTASDTRPKLTDAARTEIQPPQPIIRSPTASPIEGAQLRVTSSAPIDMGRRYRRFSARDEMPDTY
jgi:hypothetical protein